MVKYHTHTTYCPDLGIYMTVYHYAEPHTIISRNLKIFKNKNMTFITSLYSLFGGYILWNGLNEAYFSLSYNVQVILPPGSAKASTAIEGR